MIIYLSIKIFNYNFIQLVFFLIYKNQFSFVIQIQKKQIISSGSMPSSRLIIKILKFVRQNKLQQIPTEKVSLIKNFISSNRFYSYQVLGLYDFLININDKKGFVQIDSTLFPTLVDTSSLKLRRISFKVAYLRLMCLLKYQQPYSQWLEYTRELMHDVDKLSTTDIRQLSKIGTTGSYQKDPKLQKFYTQFLQYYEQQIDNIEVQALSSLQRIFRYHNGKSQEITSIKQKLQNRINQNSKYYPFRIYTTLITSNVLCYDWFFQYIFKTNSNSLKKFGFFFDFLYRNMPWKEWTLKTYGRMGVLQRMPNYNYSSSSQIINHIVSGFSITRPYFDEYFQFHYVDYKNSSNKRKALLNFQKDMQGYIMNAFLVYADGKSLPSIKILQQMKEVLEDIEKVQFKNRAIIYAYLAVENIINYHMYFDDINKKRNQQSRIIERVYNLLEKHQHLVGKPDMSQSIFPHKIRYSQHKLSCLKIYHLIGTMDLQHFKDKKLRKILDSLQYPSEDLLKNIKFQLKATSLIQKVFESYIHGKNIERPLVTCGQYKIYKNSDPSMKIQFTNVVEVEKMLPIDYAISIKQVNGSQIDLFLDMTSKVQAFQQGVTQRQKELVPTSQFWKYKYFNDWLGLNYCLVENETVQSFLQAKNYLKYIK